MQTKPSTFLALLLALFTIGCSALAGEFYTITVTVTNTPSTGHSLSINGTTRIWTNAAITASGFIQSGSDINDSATNLFSQVSAFPYTGLSLRYGNSNAVVLSGAVLSSATLSGTWGTISISTNSSLPGLPVILPLSSMASSNRTYAGSQLVADQNTYSTNAINQTNVIASELVGKTNAQTISGAKFFTGANTYSNSSQAFIGGTVSATAGRLTNGVYLTPSLDTPSMTNAVNKGNAFSSEGSAVFSQQFGADATATGILTTALGSDSHATATGATTVGCSSQASSVSSSAFGYSAAALGDAATAIGSEAYASGANSCAFGTDARSVYAYSTAIGFASQTTTDNQIMLGSSGISTVVHNLLIVQGSITNAAFTGIVTNRGALCFTRYDNSALANGNNAAVNPGTNVYMKVSGPSAAFTINGVVGGWDGRVLTIQNTTGQTMTIANNSGVDPTAANRILTGTSADITVTNNPGFVQLIWDSAASRWGVMSRSN